MLVSVIIPCYNVEQYITTCLNSVVNQTYSELEILCIDDGSSDLTREKIQHFITEHPKSKIQLITQENKGAPAARNNGIRHAKGNYLQFLDADDQLLPNKIKNQIELAKENNYPDIIVGSYKKIDENGKLILEKKYAIHSHSVWLNLIDTDLGITSSNLFKETKFKETISWNENLKSSQEYTLMFDLLKANSQVIFSPKVDTLIVSRSSGSISSLNKKENWKRYILLRKAILDYLKTNKIDVDLDKCYQLIFSAIRSLYPYDSDQAVEYFNEIMPNQFKPKISSATTKSYVLTYNIFGFKLTEKIKQFIK